MPATVVNITVNIGITSTSVYASSFNRRLLILQNISDTDIYCRVDGGVATTSSGILLKASGGGIFFDVVVPIGAVNCIHGGTGDKVLLGSAVQ